MKRLQAQGWSFSNSQTTSDLRQDYTRRSSPVLAFKEDCLVEDVDAFVSKADTFSSFSEYCRDHKLPNPGKDAFSKRLPEYVKVTSAYKGPEGHRKHSWVGISLRAKDCWGTGLAQADQT